MRLDDLIKGLGGEIRKEEVVCQFCPVNLQMWMSLRALVGNALGFRLSLGSCNVNLIEQLESCGWKGLE